MIILGVGVGVDVGVGVEVGLVGVGVGVPVGGLVGVGVLVGGEQISSQPSGKPQFFQSRERPQPPATKSGAVEGTTTHVLPSISRGQTSIWKEPHCSPPFRLAMYRKKEFELEGSATRSVKENVASIGSAFLSHGLSDSGQKKRFMWSFTFWMESVLLIIFTFNQ